MRVTAHLDSAAVGLDTWATPLDGPLSWAFAMRALGRGEDIPPTPTVSTPAADFPLPLKRWERGGWWGWRSSRAHFDSPTHISIEVRRKPATGPMSVWTRDARHHTGLGPMKARNVTRSAIVTSHHVVGRGAVGPGRPGRPPGLRDAPGGAPQCRLRPRVPLDPRSDPRRLERPRLAPGCGLPGPLLASVAQEVGP